MTILCEVFQWRKYDESMVGACLGSTTGFAKVVATNES